MEDHAADQVCGVQGPSGCISGFPKPAFQKNLPGTVANFQISAPVTLSVLGAYIQIAFGGMDEVGDGVEEIVAGLKTGRMAFGSSTETSPSR